MMSKTVEKIEETSEEIGGMEGQEGTHDSIRILEHAGSLMVKGWILMENED